MAIQKTPFLKNGPIAPEEISAILKDLKANNIGAFSIFVGQVRADTIENKKVKEIEYSAYEAMVESEMTKIINVVKEQTGILEFIQVIHSTGKVKAGEISLLVIAGSTHREQSIKAMEDIVEHIKASLPVWKKEYFEDDTYIWTQNKIEK
jgi:molybdopterin synthase catalytic subunit